MGKHQYGIVFDAGSSGTRLHLYRWDEPEHARKDADKEELQQLPKIKSKKKWVKKINPGVSTFADKPNEVGEYLQPLFEHAEKYVPSDQISQTPIFLLATAGLRMVEETKRKAILDNICTYAKENTKFLLPDCSLQIQMISGETEGLFGWIALNYLLESFDHPKEHNHGKNHHTYGFLDMGGASAQIAFAPNMTEAVAHKDKLKLLRMRRVNGEPMEYQVFVNTWLGYGANEARKEYVRKLREAAPKDTEELLDPCLPKGLKSTLEGTEIEDDDAMKNVGSPHLLGTGKVEDCIKDLHPLLEKSGPCKDSACFFTGNKAPHIDFDVNHFLGVSEYWHLTHNIFEMNEDEKKAYDFATYQKKVLEFCSMDWDQIEQSVNGHKWGKNVDEKRAMETCFKASWMINVLHDGIGIPRVGIEGNFDEDKDGKRTGFLGAFKPIDKIDDVEVSWTLGRIILYATSLIPPASNTALPVGFGSNVKSSTVPSDFQFGWSLGHGTPNLPEIASSHPILAFLALIAILGLAIYFGLGREKRGRLFRRGKDLISAISGTRAKKRWLPSGDGGVVTYERAAEFELDDMDSEEEVSGLDDVKRNQKLAALSRSESRENLGVSSGPESPIARSRSPRPR